MNKRPNPRGLGLLFIHKYMLLIITNSADFHTDAVIHKIREKKYGEFFRLNTEYLHRDYDIEIYPNEKKFLLKSKQLHNNYGAIWCVKKQYRTPLGAALAVNLQLRCMSAETTSLGGLRCGARSSFSSSKPRLAQGLHRAAARAGPWWPAALRAAAPPRRRRTLG